MLNNNRLNISDGLDFVMCEQTFSPLFSQLLFSNMLKVCFHCLTPIPIPIPIQMANVIMCRTVSTEPIPIPIPMQMGTVPNLTLISVLITGISLTLVYSSTNMSKSVWTSGFWKPLVHKNMSNFWNNIFHKLGLHFACVRVLCTFNVWMSELWCGRVTLLNHSSTIRVPKNP